MPHFLCKYPHLFACSHVSYFPPPSASILTLFYILFLNPNFHGQFTVFHWLGNLSSFTYFYSFSFHTPYLQRNLPTSKMGWKSSPHSHHNTGQGNTWRNRHASHVHCSCRGLNIYDRRKGWNGSFWQSKLLLYCKCVMILDVCKTAELVNTNWATNLSLTK